jgi:hypothetical protein
MLNGFPYKQKGPCMPKAYLKPEAGFTPGCRRLAGCLTVLVLAGCSAPTHEPPTPPPPTSQLSAEAKITVYDNPNFANAIGKIVGFQIVCADYTDPAEPSLQPEYVKWYKVTEDPATHTPPLKGYVNPYEQSLFVGGSAPQCDITGLPKPSLSTPTYPSSMPS